MGLILGKGLGRAKIKGTRCTDEVSAYASRLDPTPVWMANLDNELKNASQGVANPSMHDALVIAS